MPPDLEEGCLHSAKKFPSSLISCEWWQYLSLMPGAQPRVRPGTSRQLFLSGPYYVVHSFTYPCEVSAVFADQPLGFVVRGRPFAFEVEGRQRAGLRKAKGLERAQRTAVRVCLAAVHPSPVREAKLAATRSTRTQRCGHVARRRRR